jgi:broad specificity phosphatase PhoE
MEAQHTSLQDLFIKTSAVFHQTIEEPTTLYLIRHGQTRPPQEHEIYDYDPCLSEVGVIQSQKTAKLLRQTDLLVCNKKKRTQQTALIIRTEAKMPSIFEWGPDACDLSSWPKEMIFSIRKSRHPEASYTAAFQKDQKLYCSYASHVLERIEDILDNFQGHNIDLVTHGEAIDVLVNFFSFIMRFDLLCYPIYANCSITHIDLGRWCQVNQIAPNQTAHLL